MTYLHVLAGLSFGLLAFGYLFFRNRPNENTSHNSSRDYSSYPVNNWSSYSDNESEDEFEWYDQPGDNCVICLEVMDVHTINYLNCKHAMHTACLNVYLKKVSEALCPKCKQSISENK